MPIELHTANLCLADKSQLAYHLFQYLTSLLIVLENMTLLFDEVHLCAYYVILHIVVVDNYIYEYAMLFAFSVKMSQEPNEIMQNYFMSKM